MNPLVRQFAPWVLLAVAALGFKVQYDRYQRAIGASGVIIQQVALQRDTIRVLKDSLARASVVQKETLRVVKVRRDTVLKTVQQFIDRNVPVPVEVVREIVRADSQVIQACTVALNTCEQEKAVLRRDILAAERQRDAYKRLVPSGFRTVTTTARDVGIGIGLKILYDALRNK